MDKRKVGNRRCKCGACGEYFNSVYAFDKHRVGLYTDRRCDTSKMVKNQEGYWLSESRLTEPL